MILKGWHGVREVRCQEGKESRAREEGALENSAAGTREGRTDRMREVR